MKEQPLQAAFLVIRLAAVVLLAVYLTVHVRSLRVFRWEQSVSGGVIVTYGLAAIGLALEAGLQYEDAKTFQVSSKQIPCNMKNFFLVLISSHRSNPFKSIATSELY